MVLFFPSEHLFHHSVHTPQNLQKLVTHCGPLLEEVHRRCCYRDTTPSSTNVCSLGENCALKTWLVELCKKKKKKLIIIIIIII